MTKMTRRQFLSHTTRSLMVPSLLSPGLSMMPDLFGGEAFQGEKHLSFYNTHTGESLKRAVFWAEGQCVEDGMTMISKLFRDHRTGDVYGIDTKLIHLLHDLRVELDVDQPFHLISGYRSSKTNAQLCEKSSGVAKQSQHCLGKAADIALPGVRTLLDMGRAARSLKRGGVGVYSQFIHVDTGRVRTW